MWLAALCNQVIVPTIMPFYYTERDLEELIARAKELGIHTEVIEEERMKMRRASGERAKRICWNGIEQKAREVQDLVSKAEFNNTEELDQ